jgi:hypothetical protein
MDAQLAGEFFGATDSYHNRDAAVENVANMGANDEYNNDSSTPAEERPNELPMKSSLKSSSHDEDDGQKRSRKPGKSRRTKEGVTDPSGSGGTTPSSTPPPRHRKKGGKSNGDHVPSSSHKKRSKENGQKSNQPSTGAKKVKSPVSTGQKLTKSNFKAPPSSESFVANPTPKISSGERKTPHGKGPAAASPVPPPPPPPQAATSVPPPPPPLSGTSNEARSRPSNQEAIDYIQPIVLDDDDFSVAPSLAVEMRSITETTFDDVYQRGKKVRMCVYGHWSSAVYMFLSLAHRIASFVIVFVPCCTAARVWRICHGLYWNTQAHWSNICHQASRQIQNVLGRS